MKEAQSVGSVGDHVLYLLALQQDHCFLRHIMLVLKTSIIGLPKCLDSGCWCCLLVRFGTAIENKKKKFWPVFHLDCVSPFRDSPADVSISVMEEERVKKKGHLFYSACITIGTLVVIPPSRHTKWGCPTRQCKCCILWPECKTFISFNLLLVTCV